MNLCMATRHAKVIYLTKEAAENALEDVRGKRSKGRARGKIERTVYECTKGCGGWHLTSQTKTPPKTKRRK